VSDCVVAKYLFSATTAIVHVAASYKVVLKKEKLAAPERRWLVPNKSTRCSTVTCVSGAYPPEVRYALGGGCTYALRNHIMIYYSPSRSEGLYLTNTVLSSREMIVVHAKKRGRRRSILSSAKNRRALGSAAQDLNGQTCHAKQGLCS
jgi:hypothetical protein